MRPEDLFPDGPDSVEVDGAQMRKGSIAAFVYNALLLEGLNPASTEYREALCDLQEMVPVLRAVRVFETFSLRSERVAAAVREVDPELLG